MSESREYTDRYTNQIIQIFSQWSNQVSIQEGIIFLLIKGEHQPITLVAMGDEQSKMITVFARFSEFCPKEKIHRLTQKLNSINFEVNIGCWSVDTEDGEIRYRITQYFSNVPTVKELQMITSYIVAGVDSMTEELQTFLSITNNE